MRPRLFWKILLAFGLTLVCISQGLWLLFMLERDVPHSPEAWTAQQVAPPVIAILASTVEHDGLPGFLREQRQLPATYRDNIGIEPARQPVVLAPRAILALQRVAVAPDGTAYRLLYRYLPHSDKSPFATPWQVLAVVIICGMGFSIILARYLTQPIKLLRDGFGEMASGDFSVRLGPRIGSRRDEIANLAQHFDLMATRLGQLATARDRLLHDVSHELRSPLSRLQLAIGLARQDPARLETSLERIEHEARRLEAMVRELLILARVESGSDQVEEYFDPLAALETVFADARFEAEANAVQITVAQPDIPEEDRPSVKGSAELFRRAIENIIRNALRFSPRGGTVAIHIDLDAAHSAYRCAIRDNGPGVAADDVETIFDAFVRADVAGFGLGLAIAKRAIIAHNGSVSASNAVGGGLLVVVTIPTATDARTA